MVVIVILGLMDWYNVLNPCESPFFDICPDYPYSHHPDVLPGLYPPLIFEEACIEPHEKRLNLVGWECRPNTWKFMMAAGSYCEANCDVKIASWIYTILYWGFLSYMIGFGFRYFKQKGRSKS